MELWDSVESRDILIPITEEEKEFIDARLKEYGEDGDSGEPAAEVVSRIRMTL